MFLTPHFVWQAAWTGQLQCIVSLLQAGASVTLQDRDGWTALHVAVYRQEFECVLALLEAGSDPHLETTSGQTPRMVAETFNGPSTRPNRVSVWRALLTP